MSVTSDTNDSSKRPIADLDSSDSNDEQLTKSLKVENENMQSNVFVPVRKLARSPTRILIAPVVVTQDPPIASSSTPPPIPPKMNSPKPNTLPPSTIYGVKTHNSFAALETAHNDKSVNEAVAGKNSQRNHKQVVPPFVFTSAIDFKSGLDIVHKHALSKYFIKYMRVGTKIQVETLDTYIAIDKEMSAAKIKYFTHDLMVEQPNKYVLYGLPKVENDDVLEELKINGLEPSNIYCVSAKQQRFVDEHIYIVTLPSETNLTDVQKVKAINHTIVKWHKYENKRKGPTQCRRCFLYGHGMRNCHLQAVCEKCGQSGHSGESCQVLSEEFKCVNCKKKHIASDPECKSRKDFIEMRKKLSAANNKKKDNRSKKDSAGFVSSKDEDEFPSLPNRNNNSRRPNAETASSQKDGNKPKPRSGSYRDAVRNHHPDDTNLFSTLEIMQITKDVLRGLASCKTKDDQLEVIFQICSKYINGP